ncbi:hypothetical protein BDFG_02553 [Blastomyces dermatitidis ATCC 26199]|nr:hypothetical protein BDFG_02553 [Blastomyces dermatitidis ATCC 26199]
MATPQYSQHIKWLFGVKVDGKLQEGYYSIAVVDEWQFGCMDLEAPWANEQVCI